MAKFVPQAELPLSEQAQIRREKLAALQAEGRDPFLQTKYDFNADSAELFALSAASKAEASAADIFLSASCEPSASFSTSVK